MILGIVLHSKFIKNDSDDQMKNSKKLIPAFALDSIEYAYVQFFNQQFHVRLIQFELMCMNSMIIIN